MYGAMSLERHDLMKFKSLRVIVSLGICGAGNIDVAAASQLGTSADDTRQPSFSLTLSSSIYLCTFVCKFSPLQTAAAAGQQAHPTRRRRLDPRAFGA